MNVNWVNSIKTNGEPSKTPFVEEKQNSVEYIVERTGFEQENNNKIIEEFRKNEIKNREFKPHILNFICFLLMLQMILTTIIVFIVIISLVVGNNHLWFIYKLDSEVCKSVLDFLKYYISATIVELLGVLYFIVKQIFENNPIEMFKAISNKNSARKNK